MPTLTGKATYPDGKPASFAKVMVRLVAAVDGVAPGYTSDRAIYGLSQAEVAADGTWRVDGLVANDDPALLPSGTVYEVVVQVPGRPVAVAHARLTAAGGTVQQLRAVLALPPTALPEAHRHPLTEAIGPWALYDEFDRPDQGGLAANDIGRDRTGKLWLTTGTFPYIRRERLDTRGNSYSYVDLLRPASKIMADVVIDPDKGDGVTPTWALIWTDTMNIATWNAIHLSFQPTGSALTIYEAGAIRAPATGGGFVAYPRPLVRDGVTPNRMSLSRIGSSLLMDAGQGNYRVATDPQIGAFTGSLHVYQLNRSGGSGDRFGSSYERVGAMF